jgi:hypothetical protein
MKEACDAYEQLRRACLKWIIKSSSMLYNEKSRDIHGAIPTLKIQTLVWGRILSPVFLQARIEEFPQLSE